MKTVEILHRHAGVQVIGARGQDVFAWRRRLAGDDRIDIRVEEVRLKASEHLVEGLTRLQREGGASLFGRVCRGRKRLRGALQHEFAGRQIVVRAAVDPERIELRPSKGRVNSGGIAECAVATPAWPPNRLVGEVYHALMRLDTAGQLLGFVERDEVLVKLACHEIAEAGIPMFINSPFKQTSECAEQMEIGCG